MITFPVDSLIAILHKADKGYFKEDDFSDILQNYMENKCLKTYKQHHAYHYSRNFFDDILSMRQGGLLSVRYSQIIRYQAADRVRGEYGKKVYEKFTPSEQTLFETIAKELNQKLND